MTLCATLHEQGSFRDPRGRVYSHDGRIFRAIAPKALGDYRWLMDSGLYSRLVGKRWLTAAVEIETPSTQTGSLVIEHEKIPFVSYPYEWTFSQLKAAAVHQLDVHLEALDHGVTLSDASAYNVQFIDANPIFIDVLSFVRYQEGMFWAAHRQFCEHYLHPLLFTAKFGIPFNNWLRSNIEGLSGQDLVRLLPLHYKLSLRTFLNVTLPCWLQQSSSTNDAAVQRATKRHLSKAALKLMLTSLRDWILTMNPKAGKTTWSRYYEKDHNYSEVEAGVKHRIVSEFIAYRAPRTVWDMGCNTGIFSETVLAAGARRVIGFDFDQMALEGAYRRAKEKKLAFLPLFQDAANPSPNHGWNGAERKSLFSRNNADALIALAFEHHLAIGRNIPLDQLVAWLVSLAPVGLVEFIPRGDSNLDRLLRHREDIFENYTEANFRSAIEDVAQVDRVDVISTSGRKLYWYSRRA
ncbi:MAG TPA: class I SAM-dependent methyltransferase [Accumulibacter sp.]|jgi:ribosomal protein L11 methylase PrmA|nr:class I SAM-dependent methyltransferase [Accumulibacter sp.]